VERNVEKIITWCVRLGKEGGERGVCKVCADFLKVESSWRAEAATFVWCAKYISCVRVSASSTGCSARCQRRAHCKLRCSGWRNPNQISSMLHHPPAALGRNEKIIPKQTANV
jgi:hypothetical protein